MKKMIVLLLCLLLILTACKQSDIASSNPAETPSGTVSTPPDDSPDDPTDNLPDDSSVIGDSDGTETSEKEPNDRYPVHDIDDHRITIEGDKKTYRDAGITVCMPVDWKCSEQNGEDGGYYTFYDPEVGTDSRFAFYITFSDFARDRTEREYLELFAFSGLKDVRIESLTKETIGGYGCTKVVISYVSEGTEYIRTYYDNVVTGVRLYEFTVTYPASARETLEPVFTPIIESVVLSPL